MTSNDGAVKKGQSKGSVTTKGKAPTAKNGTQGQKILQSDKTTAQKTATAQKTKTVQPGVNKDGPPKTKQRNNNANNANNKKQSHRQTRQVDEEEEWPMERQQRSDDHGFQSLTFNRAFIYAVRHNPTGLLLMVGRYVHP